MSRRLISTGSPFERAAGYSRAVVQGNFCFVAGTTGYDYSSMYMPESVTTQTENAFETIIKALAEAGFSLQDAVRVTYYVPDAADVDEIFSVTGRYLGEIRPAATMVIAGLIKPDMKIEIELTAMKQG